MQDPTFVQKAFAGIARRYVVTNHVLSLWIDLLWRQRFAREAANLDPTRVLDLATGSGDLAIAVQKTCPNARVYGADFSVPMMREAQALTFEPLVAADGTNLPFRDNSFDLLTVGFGLRNMASWPGALDEMRRVLRPGGHLMILDFAIPSHPWIRPAYLFYLKKIVPWIAGLLTGQRQSYEYLCRSIEQFPSGPEMEALVASRGLEPLRSIPLTGGIAFAYIARA
jgi:demethylmenaquinone methyltransferase/2-methoxy-6-polyprenyl-1,4-benzoquinol methylase